MTPIIEAEREHTLDPSYLRDVILSKAIHNYKISHKITEVFNSKSWLGQSCIILGGGPSLSGFDFSCLDGMNTIGINRTFQYYPNAKINYIMDSDFYKKMIDGKYDEVGKERVFNSWLKFKGVRALLSPMVDSPYIEEVHLINRLFYRSISLDLVQGIFGGCNSGLGAMMLAIALGVNTIYLLGYDMKVEDKTHWHAGYPDNDIEEFKSKLEYFKREIEEMLPLFNKVGVHIINLNPNSALRCFPFSDLNFALTH